MLDKLLCTFNGGFYTLSNPDGGQGVQLSPGKSQMVIDFQKEYEHEAPSRGRSYLNYLMTYIKRDIQHLFYKRDKYNIKQFLAH